MQWHCPACHKEVFPQEHTANFDCGNCGRVIKHSEVVRFHNIDWQDPLISLAVAACICLLVATRCS